MPRAKGDLLADAEISALGAGLYTPAEAARLLQVAATTLRRWLRGYTYPLSAGRLKRGRPVVRGSREVEAPVTFLDLAELLVVKGFRLSGVRLPTIRVAAESAADIFGTQHPLALQRLKTDGRDIFAEIDERKGHVGLVSLGRRGQKVFPEAVEHYLSELDFDLDTGFALRWWPAGRDQTVVVDPRFSFGAPHISGTGIPTRALYEPVAAGDDAAEVAVWFGVETAQVKAAVSYEERLRAA